MSFDSFKNRHIGPNETETQEMLKKIGFSTIDELIEMTVPASIRLKRPLHLDEPMSEFEYLRHIAEIANKNKQFKTYIGRGYYNTIMPSPILRNIFENPSWYTSYTPYQAEISQGRLEALLNFQTMVLDLTGMEIANASLLDEATAAAEAMIMLFNSRTDKAKTTFFVDNNIFEQTIEVVKTRAIPLGINVVTGDYKTFDFTSNIYGVLLQYPGADGEILDYKPFVEKMQSLSVTTAVAADIMSLVLLTPPGEWGADVVLGTTQRFGIPMGYGGPHAAYFATRDKYKRAIPGRIIGLTKDRRGKTALRMALQTREQHIKRERATSNICTSQALLATMAGMYAVYHGNEGLTRIANHIQCATSTLARRLAELGYKIENENFFDTLTITTPKEITAEEIKRIAEESSINLNYIGKYTVCLSLDETITVEDLNNLVEVFAKAVIKRYRPVSIIEENYCLKESLRRKSTILSHHVFNQYRTETQLMRYIKKLENRDISLTHSMISLGSCTMKLNAATEMMPLSWSAFTNIHPFAPLNQVEGYQQILFELGEMLKEITGFDGISFQPNSGAAGEYAGLMVIRQFFIKKNQLRRNIVLIPASAHGTNPASAAMAGLDIVVVACDQNGFISMEDLKTKAEQYSDKLAAFMLTYPSTYGVFESTVREMIEIIHTHGGQVYMDGANMNAQVGLTNPGTLGVDVCHLNLHKTFAIPHGGGGPGMGPICVADHLVEFLPTHPTVPVGGKNGVGTISASPWGSALISIISYGYIKLLGAEGLAQSTKYAILNANYLAACLKENFGIVFTGENGTSAHEMIIDCRPFKAMADILETDIAKRLMDYGFHAPTVSFPVHGTLMIEPTESESKDELDRFVDALKNIYNEVIEISEGKADKSDNVLKNAPHTSEELVNDTWMHPYSREKAAFPLEWIKENKFFPYVSRTDDAYGDRNLVCSCASFS